MKYEPCSLRREVEGADGWSLRQLLHLVARDHSKGRHRVDSDSRAISEVRDRWLVMTTKASLALPWRRVEQSCNGGRTSQIQLSGLVREKRDHWQASGRGTALIREIIDERRDKEWNVGCWKGDEPDQMPSCGPARLHIRPDTTDLATLGSRSESRMSSRQMHET